MFQSQKRAQFPALQIIFLVLLVLGLLFLATKYKKYKVGVKQEEAEKEAINGLKPADWHFASREYPNFVPDLNAYSNALKSANIATLSRNGLQGFSAPWQTEGPGNIGARINCIKINPMNEDIIYVGFSSGGVWKTTDGGSTWLPIFDQQNALCIGDIELDPQNPNIIYVGTGDLNISGYVYTGNGLWKSSNGGQTWQYLGLEEQRIVSKIILHPTNSNIIYAATMGNPFERNNQRGLYKTINGGQTWQNILFISQESGIIDLEMSKTDPNTLIASSWNRFRTSTESMVNGFDSKLWKTTNGGTNWSVLENGLPTGKMGRIGIARAESNPQVNYAIFVDTTSNLQGIYRSDDQGENWLPTAMFGIDPGLFSSFGWYFGKIFVNPNDENDIFVGGVNLYRSRDGGENWELAAPEWYTYEVHADKHDMAFFVSGEALLATDGGLYHSLDDFAGWYDTESIPCTQFYRVSASPHDSDNYYGGAQDNGTTAGNKDTPEWPRIYGGDGFKMAFHPNDPNIYYFETQYGALVGSSDGFSIDVATNGINPDDRKSWDMPYLISPHNPEIMYIGTDKVYSSFGHLPTWGAISDDLTDGVIYKPQFHNISTLDESPLEAGLLYVGTSDGNVWAAQNASVWSNVQNSLPDQYVTSIKASPSKVNRVFVAYSGYRNNTNAPYIYRSDNRGQSWLAIQGDLPSFAINDVFVLPNHQDSVLFVGTDGGVYGSLDAGLHWEKLGTDMPIVPVFDLEMNPATNRLIAGTFARSLMTFPLDSLFHAPIIATNAPNTQQPKLLISPTISNGMVNISLKNASINQKTTVTIMDLNGRILKKIDYSVGDISKKNLGDLELKTGVYLAAARSNGLVWDVEKFVVVN
jgi:photosystem II stability/assembly factor-like uncharacterized protein